MNCCGERCGCTRRREGANTENTFSGTRWCLELVIASTSLVGITSTRELTSSFPRFLLLFYPYPYPYPYHHHSRVISALLSLPFCFSGFFPANFLELHVIPYSFLFVCRVSHSLCGFLLFGLVLYADVADPIITTWNCKLQEVLMGRAEYFTSFRQNADEFICSILPGISHPQVQYSPGIFPLFVIN